MKFYSDEDISPRIAQHLRKMGVDALSAHEIAMIEASDSQQLAFAAKEKRCFVTRNRDDFIKLTLQFFNDRLPHSGVLIIPYTIPGDQFARIARLLKKYSQSHSSGLEPYSIDFLPSK